MDASVLESVEPIIKKLASKYWFKVKWEYEDLLQEGRLAALIAFQDWTKHRDKRMASLSSLVYLYVTNRFKELSKKEEKLSAKAEPKVMSVAQLSQPKHKLLGNTYSAGEMRLAEVLLKNAQRY